MRVLVAEARADGHRLDYVRMLVDHLGCAGQDVSVLVGADVPGSPHFAVYLADLPSGRVHVAGPGKPWLGELARASRELPADGVLVPDGDATMLRVGLRGRWAGRGRLVLLLLRDPVRYRLRTPAGRLRAGAKRLLLARARRVSGVSVLRLAGQAPLPGGGWVPDPVVLHPGPDEETLRRSLRLDRDRFWFAVLGRVQTRKNLPITAEALAEVGPDTGLLVAGLCDADALDEAAPALERLRAGGIAVRVENRLLEAGELDALVRLVDCLVVAHSNEGPSGLLGKALAAGTRVVAAGATSLQPDVALSAGGTWAPLTRAGLAGALRRARLQERPAPVAVADPAAFASAFLDALRPRG